MAKNIDDWFIWVEANRDTPTRQWTEEVLPPAKQALYSDILELVGADENKYDAQNRVSLDIDYFEESAKVQRNRVRREIRTRLATYFGVEE